MQPEFAAGVACDRGIRRRAVPDAIPLPNGLVVRHPHLARVHHLNAILIDAPPATAPDADDVVALAERWLGDREHRHVLFDDAQAGERAAAALTAAGWEQARTVFMAFTGSAADLPRDGRARVISDEESRELALRAWAEDMSEAQLGAGLADQLATATLNGRLLSFGHGVLIHTDGHSHEEPRKPVGHDLRLSHDRRRYAFRAIDEQVPPPK